MILQRLLMLQYRQDVPRMTGMIPVIPKITVSSGHVPRMTGMILVDGKVKVVAVDVPRMTGMIPNWEM